MVRQIDRNSTVHLPFGHHAGQLHNDTGLQQLYNKEEDFAEEEQAAACSILAFYGAKQVCHLQAERWHHHCTYLIHCAQLLPK